MLYRIDELDTRAQIQALNEYILNWCFYDWNEHINSKIDDFLYASNVNGCLYDEYGNLQNITMEEYRSVEELTHDEIEILKWDYNYQKNNSTAVPIDVTDEEVLEYYQDISFVLGDFGCEDLYELEESRRR